MTSKLFIITSTISPRTGHLTYTNIRSYFTSEERFRQTLGTINSIHNSYPESQIIVLDSSDDCQNYKINLSMIDNVIFVSLKELSSNVTEIVNTHKNKSLCESLMLNTFFTHYKEYVKQFDYIIKVSARYLIFNFYNIFSEENKDKILFKSPIGFEWSDSWQHEMVDLRHEQGDNKLYQYCTVIYGFGSTHLGKFMDINESVVHLVNQKNMEHYNIESLMYFLTRQYKEIIVETPWKVSGWDGTSGNFLYY
jgi:hypothetical protein